VGAIALNFAVKPLPSGPLSQSAPRFHSRRPWTKMTTTQQRWPPREFGKHRILSGNLRSSKCIRHSWMNSNHIGSAFVHSAATTGRSRGPRGDKGCLERAQCHREHHQRATSARPLSPSPNRNGRLLLVGLTQDDYGASDTDGLHVGPYEPALCQNHAASKPSAIKRGRGSRTCAAGCGSSPAPGRVRLDLVSARVLFVL